MKHFFCTCLLLCGATLSLQAQYGLADVKVYAFDEGLSHRIVSKILQDREGYIWIANIKNGLNRFDGYEFLAHDSQTPQHRIPFDVISDMVMDDQGAIYMANPGYLTIFRPAENRSDTISIRQSSAKKEALSPYNLLRDKSGQIWMAAYDERSAATYIQVVRDGKCQRLFQAPGTYARRPIAALGEFVYIGAYENELWQLDRQGNIKQKLRLPLVGGVRQNSRIVQLQTEGDVLWVLLANGRLFKMTAGNTTRFEPHPLNTQIGSRATGLAASLLVEPNGQVWIGGLGMLLQYDNNTGKLADYDEPVRQLIKNTCLYKQIFRDRSGVLWVASDFGAVKIIPADNLFTHYLSGGSEYCNNVFCSTRGITEDEQGRIYISYYNSIHVLDPKTNNIRLLFPTSDFFNYPFGITYFDNALWTGNGLRIDLSTLKVDTIFKKPNIDLGAVIADSEGVLWFGYQHWLYQYNPRTRKLSEFKSNRGKWLEDDGSISYLHQGRERHILWVGTLGNGLYKIDKRSGQMTRYSIAVNSPVKLGSNQINAIYEDTNGLLWLATAKGVHRIRLADNALRVYKTTDGLPNDFINGLLSEGDSCIWVSTDNGLCRFSLQKEGCANFFQQDGLSSNEFNRISFYRSREGRMYFGGLNGVNAFYPGKHFLERKSEARETPVLLTQFVRYDGDSLYNYNYGLAELDEVLLTHRDKSFSFSFALADYKHPAQNAFSYFLSGYDKEWSPPSTSNVARYQNLPAGEYIFKVRARYSKDEWNRQELRIRVVVKEAYYHSAWFQTLCGMLLLGGIWGGLQYRIMAIQKNEEELERQVGVRTQELENEKKKSEELLLNILPAGIAEELKQNGFAKARRHELVTVMFSDFKDFSRISELMEPEELVTEIDLCFSAFDEIIERHGLEKIKTIGDAYLCVGGISSDDLDEALRVIRASLEIQEFMERLAIEKRQNNQPYFEARIGIHSGPLVAGIVGFKKFAYDIWGDTVNIASRMETYGTVGKVNVSETTYHLIKNYFTCVPNGHFTEHQTALQMYLVEGAVA